MTRSTFTLEVAQMKIILTTFADLTNVKMILFLACLVGMTSALGKLNSFWVYECVTCVAV